MKIALEVTAELAQCLIALEDNADFQKFLHILNDRRLGLAEWSCSPIDVTYEQRGWMQGRYQELSDVFGAWMARRKWRDLLNKQPPLPSTGDMS